MSDTDKCDVDSLLTCWQYSPARIQVCLHWFAVFCVAMVPRSVFEGANLTNRQSRLLRLHNDRAWYVQHNSFALLLAG